MSFRVLLASSLRRKRSMSIRCERLQKYNLDWAGHKRHKIINYWPRGRLSVINYWHRGRLSAIRLNRTVPPFLRSILRERFQTLYLSRPLNPLYQSDYLEFAQAKVASFAL